ncbi:MAG: hypothetical protein JWM32_3148 [Verrucomicrobia bacterium]|nr:hypothetical protein [Verrucomicrobiota bacterium]
MLMPTFAIQAVGTDGRTLRLKEDATSEATLREALRTRKLWPVAIEMRPEAPVSRTITLKQREFIAILHQLELQLRAGVTADAALTQLAEDQPAGKTRTILSHIQAQVAQGTPIHAACRYFEKQFPPHVAAIIEAGEASAQLPASLRALANNLKQVAELKQTAAKALIYPAIVLLATSGLVCFLLAGVVPKFAEIFASMRVTLPAATVVLIRASSFVRQSWPVVALAVAGIVAAFLAALRSPRLAALRDRALLALPVLGDTVRCLATARFAAHTRLLHEAGVPVLEALAVGAELTGNVILSRQLLVARTNVGAGLPLYRAFPKHHGFPGFMVPALKAGETTGQLGAALQQVEEYAAALAKEKLGTALALMEPLLLSVLTSIVGFIALSFFLPLFTLIGGVNAH